MLKKLGKLLRYEFKYYFRIMPVLYLILVLAALAVGSRTKGSYDPDENAAMAIWIALIVTVVTVNLVLVIQRFRENLLKDPGYLMFTLPVTVWSLTASKAIAALCVSLLSLLACLVSAITFAFAAEGMQAAEGMFSQFAGWWGNFGPSAFLWAAAIPVMIFQQICLVYALICASRLLPRLRTLAAAGGWFVIMALLEQPFINRLTSAVPLANAVGGGEGQLLVFTLVNLAFAAVYFAATGLLLKNTLNLD